MQSQAKDLFILLTAVAMAFFVGPSAPLRAEEQSDSRLRKFEKRLDQPSDKGTSPSTEDIRKQEEKERDRREQKRKWDREHPGQPYPDYLTKDDEPENLLDIFLEPIFTWVLGSPFTIPYMALEDNYQLPFDYPAYPFAEDNSFSSQDGRPWIGRLGINGQTVPGDTFATRIDSLTTFARRWNAEVAFTKYNERTETGSEFLSFGEALLTFTFARNDYWNFRTGLGYQRIEGNKLHHGLKTAYRVRLFRKPWQFNLDLGATLGLGASPILEIRPGVGYHWEQMEVGIGYRRVSVSREKIQGPEFGISYWF